MEEKKWKKKSGRKKVEEKKWKKKSGRRKVEEKKWKKKSGRKKVEEKKPDHWKGLVDGQVWTERTREQKVLLATRRLAHAAAQVWDRRAMPVEVGPQVVARGVDHACLIVTSGRVGSNWLLSMLAQSPSVHVMGELLSVNGMRYHPDCPPDTCGVNAPSDRAIDRVFGWMDRVNNYTKTSLFKNSGPGCRIPVEAFVTHPCHAIYLWREDFLQAYVSALRAQKEGVWVAHQSSAGSSVNNPTFNVSIPHMVQSYYQYNVRVQQTFQKLRERKRPWISIEYGDMVMNTEVTMRKVFSLIGATVPPPGATGSTAITSKIASKRALDYVTNRHEVCQAVNEHKIFVRSLLTDC